ncbi:hypothetical protein SLA2020_460970 [Shorea laevis]
MSTISLQRADFFSFSSWYGWRTRQKFHRIPLCWTIKMESKSSQARKKEELSIEIAKPQPIPHLEPSRPSDLRFDRLQRSDQGLKPGERFEFGQFVAREAVVDEEFWTAAWLRAESHWEGKPGERHIDNFKRKFAEQEFNAIKRRCRGHHWQKCRCMITVKKEERNVKRTILKSIVGTLDFSIRHLLHGESFPGEVGKPLSCSIHTAKINKYGYVSNLCVAKSARRQSIASNMLYFVMELARSDGIEQVYVHVHRNNRPAKELYQKMGFEMVELASSQLLEEQTDLLCVKT